MKPEARKYLSKIGSKGGKSKSAAKSAAARINGRKNKGKSMPPEKIFRFIITSPDKTAFFLQKGLGITFKRNEAALFLEEEAKLVLEENIDRERWGILKIK
jgi:hypothetical protein